MHIKVDPEIEFASKFAVEFGSKIDVLKIMLLNRLLQFRVLQSSSPIFDFNHCFSILETILFSWV